jgi:cholesterol oxidase
MGVRDARAYLAANDVAFEPTGPLAPPQGLRFIEKMRGAWTVGEADPQLGWDAARGDDAKLEVHLAISIEDLDVFLDDPTRVGTAKGFVICPALGGRLRIHDGTFNLLDLVGSAEREMRYTLPFTGPAGEPYRFVGIKRVAQDAPFDAWTDTTTLYSIVYRGDTDDGEIVGSGILQLRIPDLARQMTTFRIIRGRDPITYGIALLGFSRYFAGSLWDTYVRRR